MTKTECDLCYQPILNDNVVELYCSTHPNTDDMDCMFDLHSECARRLGAQEDKNGWHLDRDAFLAIMLRGLKHKKAR